jgi:hypothetical protein
VVPATAADSVSLVRGHPHLPLATHCLPHTGGQPGSRGARYCLTLIVDTADLAQLAPNLMARHRGHTWTELSPGGPGKCLLGEVRPNADPSRVATVQVHAGAEVYQVLFDGHTDTDYAYEDGDRVEALQGRIDLAAAATRGPTRVTVQLAGDVVVQSRLVVAPDGPNRLEGVAVSWPIRRLKARLRGRRLVKKILDLPAVDS